MMLNFLVFTSRVKMLSELPKKRSVSNDLKVLYLIRKWSNFFETLVKSVLFICGKNFECNAHIIFGFMGQYQKCF